MIGSRTQPDPATVRSEGASELERLLDSEMDVLSDPTHIRFSEVKGAVERASIQSTFGGGDAGNEE